MKTAKQHMMEELLQFGIVFQLPRVELAYLEAIQAELRARRWMLSDFKKALVFLKSDPAYADAARFGKWPTINDFLRARKEIGSKAFYVALSNYLAGDYWEKETIARIATPEQKNALTLAGGLQNLYARATGDTPTPIYKLIDLVAQNESEAPAQVIDTTRQISAPSSIGQILLGNNYDKTTND